MKKATVAAEIATATALQYGMSRLLSTISAHAQEREERECDVRGRAPQTTRH